ncbi:MAG TPA: heparinase II/III-family protein, partial [bacterium]
GVYVMRSDWSHDARYLIVDAGLFGSSHGHEDKLSFELFAFGKPFIIESGTYTYVYNRWHQYFESSFAHNTIVVDNRSQLRHPNEDHWVSLPVQTGTPPQKLPNVWISNQNVDYLESRYDEGYGNRKEDILKGVTHTRRILFVKPDYWILWDVVDGPGSHAIAQLFHFAAETEVGIEDQKNIRVNYPDGPALFIASLGRAEMSLAKIVGEEDPIQGWISPEYGSKIPAPVVEVESQGELPRAFVSVLYPAENGSEFEHLKIELLAVDANGRQLGDSEALAVRVQNRRRTDLLLIAPGMAGEKGFETQRTSAELLLFRQPVDGAEIREEIFAIPSSN